jgi:hypothetical protein
MNWFERHLNWTTLVIAVGSVLAFEVFTRVSLGFNNVSFEIFLDLGFQVVIMLIIVIFFCFVLSVIGYGWLLQCKNRSPWFLSFYLIIAILCLSAFVYQATSRPYLPWDTPLPFLGFSIILVFTVGWIVLLSLRKLNYTVRNDFLHSIYKPCSRLKYTVISIMIVATIVTITSYFYVSFGYIHYNPSKSQNPNMPEISFDYPAHYHKPSISFMDGVILIVNGYNIRPDTLILDRALLHGKDSFITIEYYDEQMTHNLQAVYSTLKDGVISDMHMSADPDREILDEPTTVGGLPARQLFLSVERPPPGVYGYNWGTIAKVYFELDECLWVISWKTCDEATNKPPPYFDHLLETFKISD